MPLCVLSEVGGANPIPVDVNPATYEMVPGERRMSTHVIAGDRIWQDFGSLDVDR